MNISYALAAYLPARMLGLGEESLTAEAARDRLQAIGRDDPEVGHAIADHLMASALTLIAGGHPRPTELAHYALVICSAKFPRWSA